MACISRSCIDSAGLIWIAAVESFETVQCVRPPVILFQRPDGFVPMPHRFGRSCRAGRLGRSCKAGCRVRIIAAVTMMLVGPSMVASAQSEPAFEPVRFPPPIRILPSEPVAVVSDTTAPKSSPAPLLDPPRTHLADARASNAEASIRYLTGLLLPHVPSRFDGDKHWGDTKRVWSGVDVRLDGLKLRTHRRHKDVPHGMWIKYAVDLVDAPLSLRRNVAIDDVVRIPPGANRMEAYRIDLRIETPMRFEVRRQNHRRGIRLSSVTVTGRASVAARAEIELSIYPDYATVPPAMVIDPRVETAAIDLTDFEVDRISHLGGDLAEAWGDAARAILIDRWIDKQNDRLVDKLNQAIDKNRSDLRLSITDWVSATWSGR